MESAKGNPGKMLASLLVLGWLFSSAPVFAQDQPEPRPKTPITATAPVFEVSAGYAYVSLNMPSASRVNLYGVDGNIVVNITERWGGTLDASYSRAGNVLSTGHGGSILNFLAGPVFYPMDRGKARIFTHGLAGAARVDSAVPTSKATFLGGQVTRLAYGLGAGVEYDLSRSFAFRGGADYLRTTFVDAADKLQPQNNLRAVVGLVFKLGNR